MPQAKSYRAGADQAGLPYCYLEPVPWDSNCLYTCKMTLLGDGIIPSLAASMTGLWTGPYRAASRCPLPRRACM